jgi:hypothetical protein
MLPGGGAKMLRALAGAEARRSSGSAAGQSGDAAERRGRHWGLAGSEG